ncbi:hypothetical protein BV22DRAFT_1094587 [Leucogyrophana mollusca]|uniref:Uncharacterized protein n=1 Tax=Leucogyrophana mollusca TaxID=85980 RepID=A0ACB8BB63_9AGAM|nr:hypothetical protein BV22DRAFT_1094587 [Leucogyrophana mollusca]
MMADNEQDRLLSILRAHGEQFLDSFDFPASAKKRKHSDTLASPVVEENSAHSAEEEWLGFGERTSGPSSHSDDETDESFEQEDDSFTASSSRLPSVVVFSDSRSKPAGPNPSEKALKKAFMSSKVSKVTAVQAESSSASKIDDADDERSNLQNDALLHRLLHTKLLSGSLNPELNLDHAQREKALSGRVLELSGTAKLGKGEKVAREAERNKAAKRVREGLLRKKEEREKAQLEEAKNLGNYHPSLKRVYDSTKSDAARKKRDRGLGMGVGRFSGGTLKLSREEISAVTGHSSRGSSSRGGRLREGSSRGSSSRGQSRRGRGRSRH